MRKVLVALALLGLAGGAVADDLSGGAFICHNVPDMGYTTYVEEFAGEAPLSWWCEQYVPLTSCDDQVNAIYSDEDTFYDNFYVLVAWAQPKTFCAAEFGLGGYDSGLVSFSQHGACGVDPQSIPTTTPPWPAPNSGIAIAWAADNAPSGNFVPVYFFGCYLYGSGYGSTTIPLTEDPAQAFIGTASCDVPPVTYPAYEWGTLGINAEGASACFMPGPEPEACCFGPDCVLMLEDDCIAQGGEFYGGVCDPNPCPPDVPWACCFGYDCVMLIEADCIDQGGEFQGEDVTCDPNPCIPDPGACCIGCECVVLLEADCIDQGGDFQGEGTTCDPNPCPPCEYACCFVDGSCQVATEDVCAELGGEVYYDYATCDPNPCVPLIGACCVQHECYDGIFEDECTEMGGHQWFPGVLCEDDPCEPFTPAEHHSWGEIKDMYR